MAWLDRAITLAFKSTATKRHGCVIVKGGRMVGYGYNVYRTRPFYTSPEHFDRCSVHAEAAAIRSAGGRLRGATIYVARINKRGEAMYSKPCDRCQVMLDEYGIRKAIWT